MLQVKVLIIFFGTPVFSARRDRRYLKSSVFALRLYWNRNFDRSLARTLFDLERLSLFNDV